MLKHRNKLAGAIDCLGMVCRLLGKTDNGLLDGRIGPQRLTRIRCAMRQ
jgi:hypothetical protein